MITPLPIRILPILTLWICNVASALASEPSIPTQDRLLAALTAAGITDVTTEIPATVVESGVLAFVPYTSYKLGADREVNVYGDPARPICVEIGLYRGLAESTPEKRRAVDVVQKLMPDLFLKNLSLNEGKMVWMGVIAEVTPPHAEDAFGAWWLSVYRLDRLRQEANSRESVASVVVAKNSPSNLLIQAGWTPEDLKRARPAYVPSTAPQVETSGSSGSFGSVYVKGYTRKDGTYVRPHSRRK